MQCTFLLILHVQSRKLMFQVNGLRQAQPESMYILFKKVNWTRIWNLRAKPDPTQPVFFNLRLGFNPKNQAGFGRTSLHTCCLRFCYWHFDQDLNYCMLLQSEQLTKWHLFSLKIINFHIGPFCVSLLSLEVILLSA